MYIWPPTFIFKSWVSFSGGLHSSVGHPHNLTLCPSACLMCPSDCTDCVCVTTKTVRLYVLKSVSWYLDYQTVCLTVSYLECLSNCLQSLAEYIYNSALRCIFGVSGSFYAFVDSLSSSGKMGHGCIESNFQKCLFSPVTPLEIMNHAKLSMLYFSIKTSILCNMYL